MEDVDKKFDELQKLKDKNWVVEKTVEKKKIIKVFFITFINLNS